MALQQNAVFGDMTFGDGLFAGFPGALDFFWKVQCIDESDWTEQPIDASSWTDSSININVWNEELKSVIPVNPCRKT